MFVECTVGKTVFILLSDKITEREKFNGSFFIYLFLCLQKKTFMHVQFVIHKIKVTLFYNSNRKKGAEKEENV